MTWDPELYLKFKQERFLPFDDLLYSIHAEPNLHTVDLGCGTGEITCKLADALPQSRILGIDNSAAMLEKAALLDHPGVEFKQQSIEDFLVSAAHPVPGTAVWDLVFSNAALHWIPNHRDLFGALAAKLRSRGQLAVQMPSNFRHPVQQLVIETAAQEPFASKLDGWVRRSPVMEIHEYGEFLDSAGMEDVEVWEKVYLHHLPDAQAAADWTKGTVLRPYLSRLGEFSEEFFQEYSHRVAGHFGPGPVCYSFRRTFVYARKPETS